MIDLTGRHALVVGGTSGIGKGIALAFARAGAQVMATSRDPARVAETAAELHALGSHAPEMTCDATNPDSVKRLIETVGSAWGRLDVLVCAQGTNVKKPSQDVEDALFERLIDLNLNSVFRVCRDAYPLLKASRGSVITIASMASFLGLKHAPAYSASKGAVAQLTKTLAVDWAADGIRANCLAPGWILTPLSEPILALPQYGEPILRRIPMSRFGTVDEVAGAALFLASDLATYVTGSVLVVDGGALASV